MMFFHSRSVKLPEGTSDGLRYYFFRTLIDMHVLSLYSIDIPNDRDLNGLGNPRPAFPRDFDIPSIPISAFQPGLQTAP